jgi:energy-coupling factor transporter transmembrane protein EcfT
MKIKKSPKKFSPKKIVYIVIAVLLLAALSCTVYVYAFNGSILGWSASSKNETPADNSQQTDTPSSTEETPIDNPSKGVEPSNDVPENITVIFSATNQTDTTLQIRALIEAVLGSGQCTLTLTSGSTTVTKTASVQALASSSTCTGFDIPLTELPAGEWQLNLVVTSGSSKGSVEKGITVQ